MTHDETPLDALYENLTELRELVEVDPHADYIAERDELEAEWERRTTPSQRAAMEGTGGMFTPTIRDGHFFFVTPEGGELDFEVQAGWSSVTPGLPLLLIDTDPPMELPGNGGPRMRIELNDGTIYNPKENA